MEIFCRNVPRHLKKNHFKRELTPILAEFDILAFECRVHGRGHATITIADADKAARFLTKYRQNRAQRQRPHSQLSILGTDVFVEEGKYKPDPYLISALRTEEIERRSQPRLPLSFEGGDGVTSAIKSFAIRRLSCGQFDSTSDRPTFIEYWGSTIMDGQIKFSHTKVIITINRHTNGTNRFKLDFHCSDLYEYMYVSDAVRPSITFCSYSSPHMYMLPPAAVPFLPPDMDDFQAGLLSTEKKTRVGYLDSDHRLVVSSCFVYRVALQDELKPTDISFLSKNRNIPPFERWNERACTLRLPYAHQLYVFINNLSSQSFSFLVKFQLQMLVWNGELPPYKVIRLFPHVTALLHRLSDKHVAKIIKELPRKLVTITPRTDSAEVRWERIIEILREIEESHALKYFNPGNPGYLHQNQVEIHRASVTPTGIYLDGPNPETQNRVLRKYSAHSSYFLRVRFIEESGDMLMYDISSNLDKIFRGRFREVLRDGIIIAERHFSFLGFSHSSLRTRTCWFMAPFPDCGELMTVDKIISSLGDFSHIRSPAKFAARLGQTFSDTLTSIPIEKNVVKRLPDVERNGRVFSDGCGTLSKEILWKIYPHYPRHAAVPPTVFQVRFSGAKGMLSLDSSLKGPVIYLRDSMIKFQAEQDSNIEICGSGIEKLECYLNAPLIKILEDLGVAKEVFLEMQREEIESLRQVVHSSRQLAHFLEQSHIPKSIRLPWLVSVLESLGLQYVQSPFLKKAIELALIMKLRDLKYKARIRIPKAVTLYGIMDETGILNEGEIFVPVLNSRNCREVLVRNNVIITRSPAFHPGDVQLANAVDVPEDSPLRELHNCVVFSQKGARDLPSQLSGGDLDGDLFNLIYDDRIVLRSTVPPADYPRVPGVVLDRPVTMDDIKDFFITFMQQDQLGRIAITHRVLADRHATGTRHTDCLDLAELHSTAVDFSKTGTPVDVTKIPRSPPYRPDFMALGPRVHVAESIEVLEADNRYMLDEGDDDDDVPPKRRHYRSERALGCLYRMIDEKKFLSDLQNDPDAKQPSVDVLQRLWEYVERETAGFIWDHNKDDGYYIRDMYEDGLQDIMYCYSDSPWKTTLTEEEVFIGNIMGSNHKQTRSQKESSKSMKEAYDELVNWTISLITGGGTEKKQESLERSIACFWVALQDNQNTFVPTHRLHSYPWIAAIACVQEIDKLQRTIPF